MIGFENFSVSAWFENGLTRHVSAAKTKIQRQVSTVTAGIVVATALSSIAPVGVVNAATLEIESTTMTSVTSAPAPEVPVNYWLDLKKSMQNWKVVAEPDVDYPD